MCDVVYLMREKVLHSSFKDYSFQNFNFSQLWWTDRRMGTICAGYQSVDTGILNSGALDTYNTDTRTGGPG